MRTWIGEMSIASLPAEIEKALRRRSRNVLERQRISDEAIPTIVNALFDQDGPDDMSALYSFHKS